MVSMRFSYDHYASVSNYECNDMVFLRFKFQRCQEKGARISATRCDLQ